MNPPPSTFDAILEMPFGLLGVQVDWARVTHLAFLADGTPTADVEHPVIQRLSQALNAYLRDPMTSFEVPTMAGGTAFQQRVWCAIAEIPPGRTMTYSQLAEKVGSGPRAVANACGANPLPLIIPCHRVVASTGLGGFMQGRRAESLSIKSWLLRHESDAGTA